MGLLATIDHQIKASTEGNEHSGPLHDFWYQDVGGETDSGIRITEQGALAISTVWKCVDWYFRMFGSMPKKLFERTTQLGQPAQVEAVNHSLFSLIHSAPNPTMTASYWHGLIAADLKLWGNSYAAIVRDGFGRITALVRVRPDFVRLEIQAKRLLYFIMGDDGREKPFYPEEIFHVRGLGFDGIKGYSPIRRQMNLISWNRATARYGAQFFKNASRPSGIVATDNPIPVEKKPGIIEALRASGRDAGKLILIEGATKFHKLTMDQDEAQFVLSYQGQEEDIAGIMGVNPHEIGINRNINNSITEQLTINSVTRHLAPFCVNVEQWFDLQLLSDRPSSGRGGGTERERFFMQCNLKGLLRGDTAAQTAHIVAMFDRGIYSGNDCSAYLGNAPFEGGDVRFINRAYGPIEQAANWSKVSQNNPSPTPPDPANGETEKKSQIVETRKPWLSIMAPIFRDAVGRISNKKRCVDREKTAQAMKHILTSLASGFGMQLTAPFIEDYLGAMGKRAVDWDESKADQIAAEELDRAVKALEGQ